MSLQEEVVSDEEVQSMKCLKKDVNHPIFVGDLVDEVVVASMRDCRKQERKELHVAGVVTTASLREKVWTDVVIESSHVHYRRRR